MVQIRENSTDTVHVSELKVYKDYDPDVRGFRNDYWQRNETNVAKELPKLSVKSGRSDSILKVPADARQPLEPKIRKSLRGKKLVSRLTEQ